MATFTNRARDNIRERLRTHVRPGDFRDLVTVQNFHGLAARIFRAHANVIGMDPEMTMPDRDWVNDQCRALGLSYGASDEVQGALRRAKQEARDDDEVLAELAYDRIARAIEQTRQQEQRLTYDDLLRCAELILANETIAGLYRNHFACVVVDEFQDLTPQQLRIVQRFGYGQTTYAGDIAQGIYGFAGAAPAHVKADIEAEVTRTIKLTESHRSSPAVLAMVNALSHLTEGQTLWRAARHMAWDGVAARVSLSTAADEACAALAMARYIHAQASNQRIAVIARSRTGGDSSMNASPIPPILTATDGTTRCSTRRSRRSFGGRCAASRLLVLPPHQTACRTCGTWHKVRTYKPHTRGSLLWMRWLGLPTCSPKAQAPPRSPHGLPSVMATPS